MSSRIDRVGTFRAQAVDWALAKTKNGFPQLAVVCKLVEFYDEQDGEWVDWSQYDMQETAYFCLFGTNKKTKELEPTLSCEQVMGVFDWSGESFADLAVYDPGDLVFQVRSGVNTYEAAKHPFQIEWLDEADADPTRSLKKLDAEGVKALDNEFASLLSGIKKPKAAASAKKPKPKAASAKKPKAAASAPAQGDKKLAPPPPPPSDHPEPAVSDADPVGACTKQEAWEACCELADPDCTDDQRVNAWQAAIGDVADGVEQTEITDEQWYEIKSKVLDEIGAV